MTWHSSIVLQIIFGTFNNIWLRKVTLWHPKTLYATSLLTYGVITIVGIVLAVINNDWTVPVLDSTRAVWYIVGEGFFIPISWLAQYKLLSMIGAANTAVAKTVNYITVAVFGFVLLGEPVGKGVVLGGLLLLSGVVVALSIRKPSIDSHKTVSPAIKIGLLCISSIALAIGLICEKLALNEIGVWQYTMYGWFAQFVGACVLFLLFGRKEITYITKRFIMHTIIGGLILAIAGGLFVYSLHKGMLSSTILVASANIALTAFAAIWILKERNQMIKRVISIVLVICGLVVIF